MLFMRDTLTPDTLIFHRSLGSPYSHKVMVLLGYLGEHWSSLIAPKGMPRPVQEKLVGGYCRRIPVLQVGADVYCDSELINAYLAERAGRGDLRAYEDAEAARLLLARNETVIFQSMVGSVTPGQMIRGYFTNIPFNHAWKLITDRAKLRRQMPDRQGPVLSVDAHRQRVRSFFEELDQILSDRRFLQSDARPTLLDFAVFPNIWWHRRILKMNLGDGLAAFERWFQVMDAYGTGSCREVSSQAALAVAKTGEPRPLSDALLHSDRIGQLHAHKTMDALAAITPPVEGILVGEDDRKLVLRRETDELGAIHVHFPKLTYLKDMKGAD